MTIDTLRTEIEARLPGGQVAIADKGAIYAVVATKGSQIVTLQVAVAFVEDFVGDPALAVAEQLAAKLSRENIKTVSSREHCDV